MTPSRVGLLAALLAASLLVVAAPAQALYVITPLHVDPSAAEADVGGEVVFELRPNEDDHDDPSYAGQTVIVTYRYDTMEGQHEPTEDPDAPVSSDDREAEDTREDTWALHEAARIQLDDASRATFTWTVPDEVADRNVFLDFATEDGTTLASAHVRVGEAEPMAFITSAPTEDQPLQEDGTETTEETPATDADQDAAAQDPARTPGPALLAIAAIAGLAALAMRRRAA